LGREGGTVAHTCSPSYSGGRDQEDLGLKPARANSSQDAISKNPPQKTGLVEWLKVKALSSNSRTEKKREEILIYVMVWMNLEVIMLSERSKKGQVPNTKSLQQPNSSKQSRTGVARLREGGGTVCWADFDLHGEGPEIQ
jgi:hypothetical protein